MRSGGLMTQLVSPSGSRYLARRMISELRGAGEGEGEGGSLALLTVLALIATS